MASIEVRHATKRFPRDRGARALVGRGGVMDWLRGRRRETFTALDDVSLTVEPGESLGIIGRNGSGKSTLLKLLAGVTLPTSGEVTVRGRVASLLELGAGFHPMLTGRENVYLNAGLLGMRHAQVDAVFDEIVAFSGIGAFIDQTVDTYSSGMYVRIAFATAVHTNPDIFLVDEVLAVGDEDFQRRCRVKIGELKAQGKTIVFVSHDLNIVNTLCDRIILLDQGRMLVRDTPQQTIDYYLRQVGREAGVHTMRAGETEAIFCQGRLSLFHRGRELTAPGGLRLRLAATGAWYDATTADWRVTVREAGRCEAEGDLSRLPVTLHCVIDVRDGAVACRIAMTCHREAPVEAADVLLLLTHAWDQWYYGDRSGRFPAVLPGDLEWADVAPPARGVLEAGAVSSEDAALPPTLVTCGAGKAPLKLQWWNGDYISGTRILQASRTLHPGEERAGRKLDLLSVDIDLSRTREDLDRRANDAARARTVLSGGLAARIEDGAVRLVHEGRDLTADVHLHTQFLAAGLWNFSQALLWGTVTRDGDILRVTGESRRFPLRQHWELAPAEGGVRFTVDFEALEPIDVPEFNVSLGLVPGYARWETPREAGDFPADSDGGTAWRHLNRDYGVADFARASGPGLPAVALAAAGNLPAHMTVLDGGGAMPVLQAIRFPEAGPAFHLAPGRHRAFEGLIKVG